MDFNAIVENMYLMADRDAIVWKMVSAFCYFLALVFGMICVFQLKDAAEGGGRTTYKVPLMTFLAAVLLAAAPQSIITIAASVFGDSIATTAPLSSIVNTGTSHQFGALLRFISLVGYVFFVRGIIVLKQAGEPQRYSGASVGKAVTILISAMCAIYMDVTIAVVANSTGWDVSGYISQ